MELDKGRMGQVISNILSNAIKFTKKGSISIETKIEEDTNQVIVSVRDSGSGIDLEILPKLFSKFTTKSFSGTGLGLFISKSIIEAQGGKIWAENNADGAGATFSFSIPIVAHTPENEHSLLVSENMNKSTGSVNPYTQ